MVGGFSNRFCAIETCNANRQAVQHYELIGVVHRFSSNKFYDDPGIQKKSKTDETSLHDPFIFMILGCQSADCVLSPIIARLVKEVGNKNDSHKTHN